MDFVDVEWRSLTRACCLLAGLAMACTSGGASDESSTSGESSGVGTSTETSENGEAGTGADLPDPLPARIAVTADFTAGTVSVLDADALLAASGQDLDPADITVRVHDLSMYAPGPIQVELVPGTREAVVAVGPGFFGGIVGNLIGAGEVADEGHLLHLDLDSGEVLAELPRAVPPMGMALTPDASTVLVADFGGEATTGDTVSFIDLASFTQADQLVVGGGPEQIDITPDGSRAIVNAAGPGTVRSFELSDPAGTLSAPLVTSGDPSWVHFLDDPDFAIVTNSAEPANWSIVDLSDPSAPALREQGDAISGFPYALARLDAERFLFTSMTVNVFEWHVVDVSTAPSTLSSSVTLEGSTFFPLGVAVDPQTERVLVPMAGVNQLGVIDLATDALHTFDWRGEPGPTYVALEP